MSNIRIINLSLEELRLIAQIRNISDYENKSKEDLIKALSEPKPKTKIGINKKKLEEIRKDFYKLRHLSESEIEEIRKKFNELEKSSMFKKSHGNIDSIDYDDLDNYDYNYDFAHDDEYRKIGSY